MCIRDRFLETLEYSESGKDWKTYEIDSQRVLSPRDEGGVLFLNPNIVTCYVCFLVPVLCCRIGSFTATTPAEVEQFRIKHLSKKGTIAALFDDFKNVPADQKKEIGKTLNELKTADLDKVNELKEKLCNSDQGKTGVDLTLPGDLIKLGSRHPLSIVKNEILAIFNKLGFTISEGPEIEDDWHNFSALNFPEEHPARDMQDTFFIDVYKRQILDKTIRISRSFCKDVRESCRLTSVDIIRTDSGIFPRRQRNR